MSAAERFSQSRHLSENPAFVRLCEKYAKRVRSLENQLFSASTSDSTAMHLRVAVREARAISPSNLLSELILEDEAALVKESKALGYPPR